MIFVNLSGIESASGEDSSGIDPASGEDLSGREPVHADDESGEDESGKEYGSGAGMICLVLTNLFSLISELMTLSISRIGFCSLW